MGARGSVRKNGKGERRGRAPTPVTLCPSKGPRVWGTERCKAVFAVRGKLRALRVMEAKGPKGPTEAIVGVKP